MKGSNERRLRAVADVIAGQSPDSTEVRPLGSGTPFIQGNAEFGKFSPLPIWECNTAPKHAEFGDTLISVRAPVGAINTARSRVTIGRGIAAVRSRIRDLEQWLPWALCSKRQELESRATGSTFPAISAADIKNLIVNIPEEPKRIAEYLDRETAEIDALISDQQAALELLSSRWESELVRCVQTGVNTKAHATGLDTWPHAPQAWRRTRLKATTISTRNGAWGTEPGTDETTVRCIRVADFDKIHGSIHDMNTTSRSYANAVVAESSLQPGDLILEKSGGGPTTPVGNVVRYTGPGDEMYSNFVARIKVAHEVDSAYALRLHQALYASGITTRSIKQTTGIQNLDSTSYFNEPIFLPPQTEQQRIAEYLQHRRHDIDELGADPTRAIALAKERRAALITAAVTGQIDVTAKHRPAAEQLEDDIKELT